MSSVQPSNMNLAVIRSPVRFPNKLVLFQTLCKYKKLSSLNSSEGWDAAFV